MTPGNDKRIENACCWISKVLKVKLEVHTSVEFVRLIGGFNMFVKELGEREGKA